MCISRFAAVLLAITAATGTTADAEELRIGFLTTTSGGAGVIGQSKINGFRLGLAHEGWTNDGDKLAGVPTRLFIADDQGKPDAAVAAVRRMIQGDRVQVVAGPIFSNIAMAIHPAVIEAQRVYLSTNAGPSPIAGQQCSPYFTAVSFQNDQWGEALGKLMTDEGVKRVFYVAPNYQAGKDTIAGVRRYFKEGEGSDTLLFKFGQSDFQAEISRIVAAKPEALFLFAPGGMGIAFMKQWAAAGAGKNIRVYTLGVVDDLSLAPIGTAAAGSVHTTNWGYDLPNEANQKFVKEYVAKFNMPPAYYTAQSYDAARLLAAALKKTGAKVDDTLALAHALRKAPFTSVRGNIKFDINGMPLQNWYKQEIVITDGRPSLKTTTMIFEAQKDTYRQECPEAQRY
jgi:branched-chain amino acid transport system substrate-binding protein